MTCGDDSVRGREEIHNFHWTREKISVSYSQVRGGALDTLCVIVFRLLSTAVEQEFGLEVTSLVSACLIALVSVFILLTFLAATMDLITRLFPVAEQQTDPALIAAISTAVASVYRGARVVRIEEEK